MGFKFLTVFWLCEPGLPVGQGNGCRWHNYAEGLGRGVVVQKKQGKDDWHKNKQSRDFLIRLWGNRGFYRANLLRVFIAPIIQVAL